MTGHRMEADTRRDRAGTLARTFLMLAVLHVMRALVAAGHVVVRLAGAADAYLSALLGVPRLGYAVRRLGQALSEGER